MIVSALRHHARSWLGILCHLRGRHAASDAAVDAMIQDLQVTRDQMRIEADDLARDVLGLSAADAYQKLDAGEYSGTPFAARMFAIRCLIAERHKP